MLVRSIVVEREPIYPQQETVHGFAPGLHGLGADEMQHLSDDRIGRALDRLFDADRPALLTAVVVAVGERFGVRFEELHNVWVPHTFFHFRLDTWIREFGSG